MLHVLDLVSILWWRNCPRHVKSTPSLHLISHSEPSLLEGRRICCLGPSLDPHTDDDGPPYQRAGMADPDHSSECQFATEPISPRPFTERRDQRPTPIRQHQSIAQRMHLPEPCSRDLQGTRPGTSTTVSSGRTNPPAAQGAWKRRL